MLINLLNYIVVQLRATTITKRLLCLLYLSQIGCSLASKIVILSHNIAILIGRLFWAICKPTRTNRPWALLAKIISLRGTHVGSTWFVVYLKGIIGTLLPKKVPKQKNLPIAEKMGGQWLSSIKFILENTCMQKPSPCWQNHCIFRTWSI
jgi:hypothetical protein